MKNKIRRIAIALIIILLITGCVKKETTAPIIEYQSDERIHIVKEATFTNDEVDYYMFCPTKEDTVDNCNWKIALSDSVDVARPGKWYFYFKGISKKGEESPISNVVYVERTQEELDAMKE